MSEHTTAPVFVTGNMHKVEQFKRWIELPLGHVKLDLDEIQSRHPEDVIHHKVLQAYETLKRPVFVDDFSFWFEDLNGLPGPFIKYFIEGDDALEKLCRLADSLPSRRVRSRAYFGYYDGSDLTILYGELAGEITMHPQGDADYAIGTDYVFAVDGYEGKTRGELDRQTYDELYRTIRAADKIRTFLRSTMHVEEQGESEQRRV
ncbi:MAG TPA: non-canonical purine NTP pyrophosphatase [Patescibacteria group bacterium]|jgi:non-canonical purine NTP pyrophosphatase (RdgB/HAM1 family)|nr:non-canonical purine NTP pyrophosphatase [Patescibacteria group bacterium]